MSEASARVKAPETALPAAAVSVQAPASVQAPVADWDALDRAAEGIRPSWHGASSSHPPGSGPVEVQAAITAPLPAPPSALASPWVTAPTTAGYAFEPAPAAPSPDVTHPMGMTALHADDLDLVPSTLGQFSNHPTVQRVRNWVLVRPRAVLAGGAALCVLLLIAVWPAADNPPPPLPASPKLALAPAADMPPNAPAAEPTQPAEPAASAANQAPAAAEALQPPASASKDAGASKEAALRNARNKRREAVRNNALKAAANSPRPEPRAAAAKKAPESAKASKARQLLAPNPYR